LLRHIVLANISPESNPSSNSTRKFSEHFEKIAFFLVGRAVGWFGRLASETLLGGGEYEYGSHFLAWLGSAAGKKNRKS
jgi:hypothetical protein